MTVSANSNDLNKNATKSRIITWAIVIGILIVFVSLLGLYIVSYYRNNASAKIFESAYIKILNFDKQTNVYSKQEMEKEIVPLLEQIISNYSDTGTCKRAVFYKAYILFNTEKFGESEKLFKYFIEKYSKDNLVDKSYYFLSYSYEFQNKIDDAINILKIFEKKLNSSYYTPLAFYRVGNLLEKKGDSKGALEYYQKVVDLKGDSSQKESAKKKVELLKNNIKL